MNPEDRKYTEEHEWVKLEGDRAVVGITYYAQDQLGDVVYVELPAVGAQVKQGQPFGIIESVKSASDLYAPMSGEVIEVNQDVVDAPERVNEAPYDAGWLIVVRPADLSEMGSLLSAQDYARKTEAEQDSQS